MTTDDPAWLAHVEKMIEIARAHPDVFFYRVTLPQWQRELAKLQRGGEVQASETGDNPPAINVPTGESRS